MAHSLEHLLLRTQNGLCRGQGAKVEVQRSWKLTTKCAECQLLKRVSLVVSSRSLDAGLCVPHCDPWTPGAATGVSITPLSKSHFCSRALLGEAGALSRSRTPCP
jgi:hypothetical protein